MRWALNDGWLKMTGPDSRGKRSTGPAGCLTMLAACVLSLLGSPLQVRHAASSEATTSSAPSLYGPHIDATARALEPNKGVDVWAFPGVSGALKGSGASWYLTWSTTHRGIVSPPGTQFVPMVRSAADVTAAALANAERSGPALLTFNEPDLTSQANMTVAQALSLWPQLMATNLQLGSPAVASGAATTGGWLDRFMKRAAQSHFRVNFIAVHWYGADFRTDAAVAELRSYLESVHARYGLPVWLTEYALIHFTSAGGPVYPTNAQQAAFVTASVRMLDNLPFLRRYAWFALPAPSSGPSTGLYTPGPRITAVGLAFTRA